MAKYIKYFGGDSDYHGDHIINVEHIVDFSFDERCISCTPIYGVKNDRLGTITLYKSNNKKDVSFIRELIEEFLLNDKRLLDIDL